MSWKILSAAVTVAALTVSADASVVTVTSRPVFESFSAFVPVDWGVFGPAGSLISTPDSRNVPPLTITVSSSQGALSRHDEGTDFTGDFAIGDHLLTDAGSQSDSFIVRFGDPVRGFGMQIEADAQLGAWTGSIELFDTGGNLIDTVLTSGVRGTAQDNSAPFYGVISGTANISYALFWVDQPLMFPVRSGSIAINTMDVLVPEPSSVLLVGGVLLAWCGVRRRGQGLV